MKAGVGLSFALWWNYFIIPSGIILQRHRGRVWWWSYGHMLVFASIAATGAGIHVAGYVVEGTAQIGTLGAVLSIAIPVLLFAATLFGLYTYLVHEGDAFHIALVIRPGTHAGRSGGGRGGGRGVAGGLPAIGDRVADRCRRRVRDRRPPA